jgi:hypothetical protein
MSLRRLAISYVILFYWTQWMTGTMLIAYVYHAKPRACYGLDDTWAYLWPIFKYGNDSVKMGIANLGWYLCDWY